VAGPAVAGGRVARSWVLGESMSENVCMYKH
jgi:hypothetical protein